MAASAWSSTSSRTSRRSSTSDGFRRLTGLVRLVHPFPSLLNGVVTTTVALVASGGARATSLRLGLAMIALQCSIGTLNDLLDADRDAGRTPPKPIPDGSVSVRAAQVVWIATAAVGLVLVIPSGAATFGVAVLGLGIGYGYDRFAKGTAWSWLPFAVGIPLLPVFAWLGTGMPVPSSFGVLLPCAVLAGSGLAIANAAADFEGDVAGGTGSVAVRLGLARAWAVAAVLVAVGVAVLLLSLAATDPQGPASLGAVVSTVIIGLGLAQGATVLGRRATAPQRRSAWMIQAVGMGLLATVWLLGIER